MSDPYENELKALQRSGRYRERHLHDEQMIDGASNDYLGLAHILKLHEQACASVGSFASHAPKASMLVNGYHPIHQAFEQALCEANGFEAAIVMGSGFNANIGLIESLVRKGDVLLMDEEYHASGIAGSRMCEGEVKFFPHNDPQALEKELQYYAGKRIVVAVEGIYSMGGDLLRREIIDLALKHDALILIDEAHSSGVIGPHLMGVLDHYAIAYHPHIIKMGTLGKAYGSFGAYVLSSQHISEYLINRAKNVIYATAPSLYETALAHHSLNYILDNAPILREEISKRQKIVKEILEIEVEGLIVPIAIGDNRRVMELQSLLREELGVWVGAIRQPTVSKAIIRLIARLGMDCESLAKTCTLLSAYKVK